MWTKNSQWKASTKPHYLSQLMEISFFFKLVSKIFIPFDTRKKIMCIPTCLGHCLFYCSTKPVILDKKHLLVKHKYLMSFKLINLKAGTGTFNIEAFTIGVPIDQFPIERCGIFTRVFLFACSILLGYITTTNTNVYK